jgi:hypothetical protein
LLRKKPSAVKPIKVEKLKVKEFTHLIHKATKEEIVYFFL